MRRHVIGFPALPRTARMQSVFTAYAYSTAIDTTVTQWTLAQQNV